MSEITLEQATEEIKIWRQSKKTKRDPIPFHLWKAAVKLSKIYSSKIVSDAMKISHTDLRKKLGISPATKKLHKSKEDISFAKLPITSLAVNNNPSIILTTPSGITVKVY